MIQIEGGEIETDDIQGQGQSILGIGRNAFTGNSERSRGGAGLTVPLYALSQRPLTSGDL